jgi:hypothetical protein
LFVAPGDPVLHVQGGRDNDLAPSWTQTRDSSSPPSSTLMTLKSPACPQSKETPTSSSPTMVSSVMLTPDLLCLVNTLCTTNSSTCCSCLFFL